MSSEAPAPEPRRNLSTLVLDMEHWGASADAVVEHRGVRRLATSYAAVAANARRFAAELDARGIGTGERVVLWGANSAAWMSVFFGCVLRGVLVVPLDAAGTMEFAERIVREVSPRLIVGDGALLRGLSAGGTAHIALDALLEMLAGRPQAQAWKGLAGETPLQILFTSGTTGEPKGVVHTHGNLLASLGPIEREISKYRRYERWVHPLRFLHTLPLSHVFGQFMGLWVPPLLGAVVHFEQRGTASHLVALIPRERINVLAAVPRTLALLRNHLLSQNPELRGEIAAAQGERILRRWWRFRDVHRAMGLRFWAAVCGGATLEPELEQFWTTMGFALVQGYGLTETAALVTLNHPFKPSRGSLGAPLPGRELRVGETGELEVKGDMVSGSSWAGGRLVLRENPWLPTGDLASLGEDGRIRFLGRTGQRLVTAAGLNVYLQDVEQALERQDGVNSAVVLAMPGVDGGEEPAAVLLARGGSTEASTAVAMANRGLGAHQQIRRWWVWPELELPRTATGKVKRGVVESWARAQSAAVPSVAGVPGEQDAVARLLTGIAGRSGPVDDDARLDEEWGLDSMGRVALASALEEKLGVPVGDSAIAELRTVGDLRGMVRGHPLEERNVSQRIADASAAPVQLEQDGDAQEAATFAVAREGGERTAGIMYGSGTVHEGSRAVPMHYPAWPWSWPVVALRFVFVEAFLRPMVAVLGAPRVRRAASSLPGPMLIVANHRKAMDVPLLLYALPFAVRQKTAVAMSGEMLAGWESSWSLRTLPLAVEEHRRWWGPVAAFLLRALLNVFPLPRTSGFRQGFAHAGRALDRGYSVMIFPEGRRVRTGEPLRFKAGLGILAVEAFVPVLPAALAISDEGRLRSGPIISIGTPATVDGTNSPEDLTDRLRVAVQALLAAEIDGTS